MSISKTILATIVEFVNEHDEWWDHQIQTAEKRGTEEVTDWLNFAQAANTDDMVTYALAKFVALVDGHLIDWLNSDDSDDLESALLGQARSLTKGLSFQQPTITLSDRIDPKMMDALSQAERLAYEHPTLSAVIYRTVEKNNTDLKAVKGLIEKIYVRLSTDPAPAESEQIMTVTRRSFVHEGLGRDTLGQVVNQVVANLPEGVMLAHKALIENYPQRRYDTAPPSIFAYQFMSTEGRNVATWIPDVSKAGAQMQMGSDGRGRIWGMPKPEKQPSQNISQFVEDAESRLRQSTNELGQGSGRDQSYPRPTL